MSKTGTELLELIESIVPAVMVNHDADLAKEDQKKDPNIGTSIWPYARHALNEGVTGKRFASDCWQNSPGWAVAVPEIVQWNDEIHLVCRWWNWIGGFVSRVKLSKATVQTPDEKTQEGWIVYKQGQGYQSNSQYFVTKTGEIYEYTKTVTSHDPVRYMPTGGHNVGWTETVISASLARADLRSNDLKELISLIKGSIEEHNSARLRPIMKKYFTKG